MPKIYSHELKKSVVNFYKSNIWSIDNALQIFNVSKSSIYSWIKMDKENLLFKDSNVRCDYEKKINNEIEKYIVSHVTKKVNFNKKNIKRYTKRKFNISISKSSIYRVLKKNNITNKKIYKKIIPTNKNIKKEVTDLIIKVKEIGFDNIVSIDESSFDTHIRSTYGWSLKGLPINKILNTSVRNRQTLTLAIKNNKVLAYNLIQNSSNALNFEKFLKEDVLPKINNETILMDNVRFHHSKIVKDCITNSGNEILYNISYHPDTNPVENCFFVMKNYVSKNDPSTKNQLKNLIDKSIKLLTPTKLKNMFNNSFNNLQICK